MEKFKIYRVKAGPDDGPAKIHYLKSIGPRGTVEKFATGRGDAEEFNRAEYDRLVSFHADKVNSGDFFTLRDDEPDPKPNDVRRPNVDTGRVALEDHPKPVVPESVRPFVIPDPGAIDPKTDAGKPQDKPSPHAQPKPEAKK